MCQKTTAVVPAGSTERKRLEAQGWRVIAESWGAQLRAERVDRESLRRLRDRHPDVRQLAAVDADAVLALDSATLDDYPSGVATRHEPLDSATATPTTNRVAYGAVTSARDIVAMTFVDRDGDRAEVDFTVVRADSRGRGLGLAVKAASILALLDEGVAVFRTGGSSENTAIIRANAALGFERDETWVTLTSP